MKIGPNNIHQILAALEQQLSIREGVPVTLVVCGGTALAVQELVLRTTADVDVIGTASDSPNGLILLPLPALPEHVREAAEKVRRDFNLPEGWLNTGPASQIETGMPEGVETRLIRKVYGPFLTICFLGRFDLIHLKLYAAVDSASRNDVHVQDLLALDPTDEELEKAARWVVTQDVSETFRILLIDLLKELGRESVARRIL